MAFHIGDHFVSRESSSSDLDSDSFHYVGSCVQDCLETPGHGTTLSPTMHRPLILPCSNLTFDDIAKNYDQLRLPFLEQPYSCEGCVQTPAQKVCDGTEELVEEEARSNDGELNALMSLSSNILPDNGNCRWAPVSEDCITVPESSTDHVDGMYGSVHPRAPSPSVYSVSSVASTQRLEWDSGADIGYGALKSMFGLSTLERMAIGSCCSVLKQMELDGDSVPSRRNVNALLQGAVDDPHLLLSDLRVADKCVDKVDCDNAGQPDPNIQMLRSETEDERAQLEEYQRQLDLENVIDDCSLQSSDLSSTESKGLNLQPDIKSRILALKTTEKRSKSLTDLSNPVYGKNCHLNKSKCLRSFSASDMLQITSGSTSSSCSARSLNSSGTVVQMTLKPEMPAKPSLMATTAMLNGNPSLPPCGQDIKPCTDKAEVDVCEEETTKYNCKVSQFVNNLVDKLCVNSDGKKKQHLLKKILEDLKIPLIRNKGHRHSPGSFLTDLAQDLTGSSLVEFPDGLDNTLYISYWNMQHLNMSCAEVQEMSNLYHEALEDGNVQSSARDLFVGLGHMVAAQPESLQLLKELMARCGQNNIRRIQRDVRWLQHIEAMLHEQEKQEDIGLPKRSSVDLDFKTSLTGGVRKQPELMSIECSPLSSSSGIYRMPAYSDCMVAHQRSVGVQTSVLQDKSFIFQRPTLNSCCVEKEVMRKRSSTPNDTQNKSTKFSWRISVPRLPRPVSWFLPLTECQHGRQLGNRRPRTKDDKIGACDIETLSQEKNCKPVSQMFEADAILHFKKGQENITAPDTIMHLRKEQDKVTCRSDVVSVKAGRGPDVGMEQIRTGFRKFTVPISLSAQHHNPNYRHLSHNEMQIQTKKIYKVLPEVTIKNELKHREDAYKANRLVAHLYRKKLQKKVLAGHVSLLTTERCQ